MSKARGSAWCKKCFYTEAFFPDNCEDCEFDPKGGSPTGFKSPEYFKKPRPSAEAQKKPIWRQCECMGYRAYTERDAGKLVPVGGCGACDKIRMLQEMIDVGVKIRHGSDVTRDPDNLFERAEKAEERVEELASGVRKALSDLNVLSIAFDKDFSPMTNHLKKLLGEKV